MELKLNTDMTGSKVHMAWRAAIHGFAESRIHLIDGNELS